MLLPNDHTTILAIDTEAHTPNLKERGPRGIQGEHYAIGISLCADDGFKAYYPVRHSTGNTEIQIIPWLRDWVSKPDNLAIFAHAKFDIEMLMTLGIEVKCKCYDILAVDALINENHRDYSLNAIAKRYGYEGKDKALMEDKMRELGLVMPHNKKKVDYGRMREIPPEFVREYAETDAQMTMMCFASQKSRIAEQRLERVVALENDLIPVLWDMRRQGVPVDLAKADSVNIEMKAQGDIYLQNVREMSPDFEPFASRSTEKYINSFGLSPPRSPTNEPSVTNEWLVNTGIPELKDLAQYRQHEKMRRDFVEAVVINDNYKGLIYPSWFSTRGSGFMSGDDPNGTRSGRIACELPNLAQIPSRHKVLGPRMRSMFVPFPGQKWHKADYRSQEPRITLHYALKWDLPGSHELAKVYHDNPLTDYHKAVTDMVNEVIAPAKIERLEGKTINLGLVYGMGRDKLAASLKMSREAADRLIESYFIAVPYAKDLQDLAKTYADEKGFITTELGRRRHFDLWEPRAFSKKKVKPLPLEQAKAEWKVVRRAMTYKALNSSIQGTAAEQMKLAMKQLHAEGLTPLVTLYDELGHSIPDDPAVSARICEVMEHSLPSMMIPHSVESKIGNNWAGT